MPLDVNDVTPCNIYARVHEFSKLSCMLPQQRTTPVVVIRRRSARDRHAHFDAHDGICSVVPKGIAVHHNGSSHA